MDTNEDNMLDIGEFQSGLAGAGLVLSEDDCAKVFSTINAAHGGCVNKEDFVTTMRAKYDMEEARRKQQSIVYILESKANKEKDRSQRKVSTT